MLTNDDSGTELVEFAVVLPMLLMVLTGFFWFGRVLNISETLVRAAREGAVYGSRPVCALCSNDCLEMPSFPCSTQVGDTAVIPALRADKVDYSSLDIIPQPKFTSCAQDETRSFTLCPTHGTGDTAQCFSYKNENKIWICRCVNLTPGAFHGSCGVAVTMTYPWKWRFPFTGLDMVKIPVSATVTQRQEF